MELTYSLGLADVIAFNEHVLSTDGVPDLRREALINAAAAFGAAALVIYLVEKNVPAAVVVGGVVAAVLGLAWPSVRRSQFTKAIPKAVARLHDASRPDGIVGTHTIRIGPGGLVDETAVSETRHAWQGIREIRVTGSYLYLLVRPLTALIVPLRAIPDLENVVRQLVEYVGESSIRRLDRSAA